jgi:hypothetical protein
VCGNASCNEVWEKANYEETRDSRVDAGAGFGEPSSSGQTTFATITGSAADPSGAVVPGAVVTVTNLETDYESKTESNESGTYTLPQLRAGTYTLKASAPGFQEFQIDQLILAARDVRRVDVQLNVTAVTTNVEVTARVTLIETETARIRNIKSKFVPRPDTSCAIRYSLTSLSS